MEQDYQIPLDRLGALLSKARERAGISQAKIAETLGVSEVWLSMIENGRGKPSLKLLRRMCAALKDPHLWAAAVGGVHIGPQVPGSGHSVVMERADREPTIPVVGHVSAGPSRIAWTDEGLPVGGGDDYVAAHADLKDPNAFALRIKGDSMAPCMRDGDVVIISPKLARVRAGDEAIVQLRDGKSYLKVVYPRGGMLVLQSVNPAYEPLVVPRSEVRKMWRVADVRRRR